MRFYHIAYRSRRAVRWNRDICNLMHVLPPTMFCLGWYSSSLNVKLFLSAKHFNSLSLNVTKRITGRRMKGKLKKTNLRREKAVARENSLNFILLFSFSNCHWERPMMLENLPTAKYKAQWIRDSAGISWSFSSSNHFEVRFIFWQCKKKKDQWSLCVKQEWPQLCHNTNNQIDFTLCVFGY